MRIQQVDLSLYKKLYFSRKCFYILQKKIANSTPKICHFFAIIIIILTSIKSLCENAGSEVEAEVTLNSLKTRKVN